MRLANRAHDRESVRLCQAALADAEGAAADSDLAELSLANRRFHAALYAPCPNELLVSTLDDIQDRVALISRSAWRRRSTWAGEAEEHGAILDAVAAGHSDLGAKRLRRHIGRFLTRVGDEASREPMRKEESE